MPVGECLPAAKEIQRVSELARRRGATVVVLHVHDIVRGRVLSDREPDEDCIATIVSRTLTQSGIPARPQVVASPLVSLPEVIARVASDIGADSVVIGDGSAPWTSPRRTSDLVRQCLAPAVELVTVR